MSAAVWASFGVTGDLDALDAATIDPLDELGVWRTTPYLTHPVFMSGHSETEMLRYLRRLADADLALDRTMIPLGSCTMKLNATTEMEPITWPEFAGLHPFAPVGDSAGTRELIAQLEAWLVEITGYDAVSLQPNAGSQGEFAGLLAIRAFHRAAGDDQRVVCLIPSSAHGTNAASAVMAGLRVVVVACDEQGNVDVDDLRAKIAQHSDALAALMITYPSTHGVFEESVGEICALVHDAGGQVYVDGANLNALVGLAQPGRFGADVSHLNLHKTFCIPHGGGGPGVGPVGVRAHLAPYLPNHPLVAEAGPATGVGPIAGAPWGSAGILPISWAYVRLMGGAGLTRATEVAILSANYLAHRLAPHFPVLYTGRGGLVAHECIVDLRGITKDTGVTAEDVAKRLIDYGFHAPTLSFPVSGTLMIEPTESEGLAELDRFCEAMIAIRAEIDRVAAGEWAHADSPLAQAPHTAAELAGEWAHPYTREEAAYPVPVVAPHQVLGSGPAHRRCARRPQPGLCLPARRGVRVRVNVEAGPGRLRPADPAAPGDEWRRRHGRTDGAAWCGSTRTSSAGRGSPGATSTRRPRTRRSPSRSSGSATCSDPWEWKHYSYDQPSDLGERLVAAGFTAEPPETLMVAQVSDLDLDVDLPDGVRLHDITDPAEVPLLMRAADEAFGRGQPAPGGSLEVQLRDHPDTVRVVVALAGDRPVSGGRLELARGTDFASLWGGGTIPEWRSRGIFRALVAHRAALAAAAGLSLPAGRRLGGEPTDPRSTSGSSRWRPRRRTSIRVPPDHAARATRRPRCAPRTRSRRPGRGRRWVRGAGPGRRRPRPRCEPGRRPYGRTSGRATAPSRAARRTRGARSHRAPRANSARITAAASAMTSDPRPWPCRAGAVAIAST